MVLGMQLTHRWHRGSVLPRVPLERSAEGVRVIAATTGWKDALNFWVPAVFLALFIAVIVVFATGRARQLQGVLAIGFAGVGLAEIGRRYFRQRRLQRATLLVRRWPLRLGERTEVRFAKRLKKNAAVDRVTARLACVEEATLSSGRYQEVRRAVRYERPLDTSRAIIEPGSVRDEWTLEIPADAVPSFAAKSNQVRWLVEAITASDGVDVAAEFELVVIPEVAR